LIYNRQNREQEKERLNAGKITDKNVTKKNKNEKIKKII